MKKMISMTIGILISTSVVGQNNKMSQSESTTIQSEMNTTHDGLSSNILSEQDRSLARQWNLPDTDWIKYKQIMSGPRGIWSPGLDPITALGVSETDPHERRRYAELWIEVETKRTKLELAFEVERHRVGKLMMGNRKAIDTSKWIAELKEKQNAIRERVTLFVDSQCQKECKDLFESLHASLGTHTRLDIYFKGGATAENIGEWASFMKIPTEAVQARVITLNFDDGKSNELGVNMDALPVVKEIKHAARN